MKATILVGDCLAKMREIPDKTFQACVTSPPYWGLRDYGNETQIGTEETPSEYVAKLVEVFREVWRVLKDDGTLWLNLGDSYCGGGGFAPDAPCNQKRARGDGWGAMNAFSQREGEARKKLRPGYVPEGFKVKDLAGIPWRVALALHAEGWWLRQDIIWAKPNPMPESATDRCTRAHEYVFLMSKRQAYFFDAAAMKEPATSKGDERIRRDVWMIQSSPYAGAHFATMPIELASTCIRAATRIGDHVLDPFGGSGTTASAAIAIQRDATICELNPQYAELAKKRITETDSMFTTLEIK